MIRHKSTAFIGALGGRDKVSSQFRFVIRAAVAAHDAGLDYEMRWWSVLDSHRTNRRMAVTFESEIPPTFSPKPLPKLALAKPRRDWKPRMFEAEYRLDAWEGDKRKRPGFVISHSSGLSLVHPSESDELGGDDADIRQNWRVTHTGSVWGFGLTLNFKRATDALTLAASFPVDWTQDAETLKPNPEFRKAGYTVQAEYSKGFDRDSAIRRLAELERAA